MMRCIWGLVVLMGCSRADGGQVGGDAGGGGCVRDEDCGAEAPVCDVASGVCGACTDGFGCSRFEGAPYCVVGECVGCGEPGETAFCASVGWEICDAAGRCRGCESNAECSSGACAEGECVAEQAAIYVEPGGSPTGECTRDEPCGSIARGMEVAAEGRQVIVLADGMYDEAVVVNPTTYAPVWLDLVADRAIIQRPTTGPVVRIRDVPVRLERVVIQRGSGATGVGIDCAAIDGPNFPVTTRDVTIRDNAGGGILSEGCDVWLDRGSVMGNGGDGVRTNGGGLGVSYSVIEDNSGLGLIANGNGSASINSSWVLGNAGGGVDLDAAIYVLFDCIIGANGNLIDAQVGGLALGATGPEAAGFEHLTIAANRAASGGSPGIRCADSAAVRNSIVWGNEGGEEQVEGLCKPTYALVSGPVPPGAGNLMGDPDFVDPAAGNFDIGNASDAIDRGDPESGPTLDIHRERRGEGELADLGADEYVPR